MTVRPRFLPSRRQLLPLGLGLVVLLLLSRLPADPDRLVPAGLERSFFPGLAARLAPHGGAAGREIVLSLDGPGAAGVRPVLERELEAQAAAAPDSAQMPLHLSLAWTQESRHALQLRGSIRTLRLETFVDERVPLPGWESLLPPLVAIVLAFAFRQTLLCLFAGIWVGATLIVGGSPLTGLFWVGYEGILRHALLDRFRIEILVFIFGLVGTVGIMSRMGGVAGLLRAAGGAVRGVRSTQLFASAMGLAIFFDDYANTILVGTTMRPLTDRWRVSRERLAYIVDSTAAPVAGLSALSTWVAYEMSLYADQLPAAGMHQDAYIVFLRTLPFRFYSIFTLLLVFMGAAMDRSFGPMLRAERRARAGAVSPEDETGGRAERLSAKALRRTAAKPGLPARWINGALPLAVIVGVTVALMLAYGDVDGRGLAALGDLVYLRDTVLSNTQSARALAFASIAGFAVAILLARGQKLLGWREALSAGVGNFSAMLEAVGILILAWVMGRVCDDLGTSHALIAATGGRLADMALIFPLILFLTSASVSFATGSSWSTMAILLPNVTVLAARLGEGTALGAEGLLLLSIGAVLEGSIFGDHCSPISDTTVLSSVASSCPHMAHVKTQAPIALAALGLSVVAGYLPVALGLPVGASLAIGAVAAWLLLRVVGRVPGAA
ncbi:MAG: Na+/H+ antiporter NhaC family protein [Candidatus Latescibacteria bacterium]|nr:Na+/H+ antiporter NhaC family protein [Candidatus Latescibacterota bacterium]